MLYTDICLDLCDPTRPRPVNMLELLFLYNRIYINIMDGKWIYIM